MRLVETDIERGHPAAVNGPVPIEGPRLRAFLHGLVGGMRCGVLAVDRELRIVLLNEVGCKALRIEAAPSAGTPVAEAFPDYPELVRVLADSFSMDCLPNRAELELELADGRRTSVGFTLSLVGDEAGDPVGVAMFFKDLTVIERRQEQDRLNDRLIALGQMAASMAHEIRNPLASIDITCSLLQRKLTDDVPRLELARRIHGEVRRLNAIVSSSLEHVRPVTLQLTEQSLEALVRDALRVAAGRFPEGSIETEVRRLADVGPQWVDRDRLRQVFENLLLNALEAMHGSGRIVIEIDSETIERDPSVVPYAPRGGERWHETGEQSVIRVIDSGPGIPADVRERIFNPFFTTKETGSGVGLSTVKKIVDAHRGTIDVANADPVGTIFTIGLPAMHHAPED